MTLVLSQWFGQQRLAGIAEGVLGHRSEVVSRIESVAGGCLDECVHRGRHFRSQDGLAPVVILPAHDKSPFIVRLLALAPRRCITDGTLRLGPKSSSRIASTVAAKQ